MLTQEQEEILAAQYYPDPFAPQRAVVPNMQSLWPSGIVPYVLDWNLSKYAVVDNLGKYASAFVGSPSRNTVRPHHKSAFYKDSVFI